MMGRLDRPSLRWWHKREITVPVGDPNDAGQELQFSRSVLSEPAHDFYFSYKKRRARNKRNIAARHSSARAFKQDHAYDLARVVLDVLPQRARLAKRLILRLMGASLECMHHEGIRLRPHR
jgi:hypothetical protein